jgi:hypothetical protein
VLPKPNHLNRHVVTGKTGATRKATVLEEEGDFQMRQQLNDNFFKEDTILL